MKSFLDLQKEYNEKIYGKNLSNKDRERITQELVLCAHAELSSLVSATSYRKHHNDNVGANKSKIIYESVDVIRYVMAIMNLWNIDSMKFDDAFRKKDIYLNTRKRISENKWNGQPVAIVDMDDILVEFREGFAKWLSLKKSIYPDVNSKEYYFIDDLKGTGCNPEEVFSEFVLDGGFYTHLSPVKKCAWFIDMLEKRGYWIHILTARPSSDLVCLYDTYSWLSKTGLYFDDISFASEKFRWCAQSKYYNSDSIRFAIDDSPKHVMDYTKHGITCFYPFKTYNESSSDMKGAKGYSSFEDLLEIIDKRHSH